LNNIVQLNTVIIDTNILLLYLAGIFDISLIKNSKLFYKYDFKDYFLLFNYLKKYTKFLITPHILTETSNLISKGITKRNSEFYKLVIDKLLGFQEENLNKDNLLRSESFIKFGVTDAGIIQIAHRKNVMILTDDFPLYKELIDKKLPVENFNHIRQSHLS